MSYPQGFVGILCIWVGYLWGKN